MREFARKSSRLRSLTWETRFVYTSYLVFSLAAYVVIGFLIADRTTIGTESYALYYQGNEEIGLYGKTRGELLETTHFHLFSYPLFILVQGHIFLMTTWPRYLKAGLVAACFLGAFVYLGSPWLVVYGGASWAWFAQAGRILMVPPLLAFVFVPLWEMWWTKPNPPEKK